MKEKKKYAKVSKNPQTFTLVNDNGKARYIHGVSCSETATDYVVNFVDRGRNLSEFFPKADWRLKRSSGPVEPAQVGDTRSLDAPPAPEFLLAPKPERGKGGTGDLKKTISQTEYNAWDPPDRMGPDLLNTAANDAKVATTFAVDDAKRRMTILKAKSQLANRAAPPVGSGVAVSTGWMPES